MNTENKPPCIKKMMNEALSEMKRGIPLDLPSQLKVLQKNLSDIANNAEGTLNEINLEFAKAVRDFEIASGRVVKHHHINMPDTEGGETVVTVELVPIESIERAYFNGTNDIDG